MTMLIVAVPIILALLLASYDKRVKRSPDRRELVADDWLEQRARQAGFDLRR